MNLFYNEQELANLQAQVKRAEQQRAQMRPSLADTEALARATRPAANHLKGKPRGKPTTAPRQTHRARSTLVFACSAGAIAFIGCIGFVLELLK